VEAGSRVQRGDPLVALSAAEFQARVHQAQAGVAQAAAHLAQVKADYKRYQRLFKEGAVSPREFEAMATRHRAAQASLAQAQAQVQEAATIEQYTRIVAPRDGVVAERRAAVGDLAQPGQSLLTLYDPRDLQVEGEVNDEYRSRLSLGLQVGLEVPALKYTGTVAVAEIFPISMSQSRTFTVRTERLAIPGLIPGMFARLTIPVGKTRGLLIPQAAVRRIGQLTTVEVMAEDHPRSRLVQLGRKLGGMVEILAGLKPGDRILVP
jgi:RND family efflux transporter MFP subunit